MSEAIAGSGLTRQVGCFLDDLAMGGGSHTASATNVGRMLDKVHLGLEELPFLGFLLR